VSESNRHIMKSEASEFDSRISSRG